MMLQFHENSSEKVQMLQTTPRKRSMLLDTSCTLDFLYNYLELLLATRTTWRSECHLCIANWNGRGGRQRYVQDGCVIKKYCMLTQCALSYCIVKCILCTEKICATPSSMRTQEARTPIGAVRVLFTRRLTLLFISNMCRVSASTS